MTRRQAGILLHPTSLPGRFGVGDLGPETVRFLDWMAAAGQSIWQILPLGPTGFSNSPYVALSAFAGNPLLISPERLADEGLIGSDALDRVPASLRGHVDFGAVAPWKDRLLREAWTRAATGSGSSATIRAEVRTWSDAPEQADWLPAWALYAAVKRRHGGKSWLEWAPALRRREPKALAKAAAQAREEIEYQEFLQWVFHRQWEGVRRAARERGIEILGDLPIYVPLDSTEVWERPDCFQLDRHLRPEAVSGVPPDYFSDTGQLWGTPLYRWDRIEADGFAWWIRRARSELRRFDLLRLDHFRGFETYWSVPAGAPTAVEGRWCRGPGMRLFRALEAALGRLPLVAEDLGDIDDDVRRFVRESGFPGMRVLQFGFADPESLDRPDRYPAHCVAYTGTHDNETLRGWLEGIPETERARVIEWLRAGPDWEPARGSGATAPVSNGDLDAVARSLIRALYASKADRAIVPMQDVLCLGNEARMNTPAIEDGNWSWRLLDDYSDVAEPEGLRSAVTASRRAASERPPG